MATKLYCQKCRDLYGERIAHHKDSKDIFRQVVVTAHLAGASYQCECRHCGHKWRSVSPEAKLLFDSPSA